LQLEFGAVLKRSSKFGIKLQPNASPNPFRVKRSRVEHSQSYRTMCRTIKLVQTTNQLFSSDWQRLGFGRRFLTAGATQSIRHSFSQSKEQVQLPLKSMAAIQLCGNKTQAVQVRAKGQPSRCKGVNTRGQPKQGSRPLDILLVCVPRCRG
jgi:hypothetical protein